MDQSIGLGGSVIFWRITDFYDRNKLVEGFKQLGLEKFTPHDSTRDANLRYALQEIFTARDLMIRPKKSGWGIVRETREDAANGRPNQYAETCAFWLDVQGDSATLKMEPFNEVVAGEVVRTYNKYFGLIAGSKVTDALVAVVGYMHGTTLREKGGLYWISEVYVNLWRRLREVISDAAVRGASTLYIISHKLDPDSVRAVKDSLVDEIEAEMKGLQHDVDEGELGSKALQARKEATNSLISKCEMYEQLLGEGLDALKLRLGTLGQNAALAAFRAAAAKRREAVNATA